LPIDTVLLLSLFITVVVIQRASVSKR